MSSDIWPVVHAERRALAADLEGLAPERWQTRSLCTDWSVHDVLAHMVATAKETPPGFFVGLVTSGFSLSKHTAKRIAAERTGGPDRDPRGLPGGGVVHRGPARTEAELAR